MSEPARSPILRIACPACRGSDSALYHPRSGRVSCRCGFQSDYSGFLAEVDRQASTYLLEFPGLADGSSFKAAVELADGLLKKGVPAGLAADLTRSFARTHATPPLPEWQAEEAIEIASKRELRRRGLQP